MFVSGIFTIEIRNRTELKPTNRRIAEGNMVYIQKGILFGHYKKNEIMVFAGKWMDGTRDHC